ncbi:hypothetical protein ACFX13_019825 [Malus domestica]
MVSGYANCGKPDKAVGLYNRMLESESEVPNGFMYSAVLIPCGLLGDLRTGKLIHERICGERLELDTVLMNNLLDMYFKCGSLIDARRVFDDISSKNTTTWHTLVSGFTEAGLMEEAVSLFHQMKEPSVVSWNSIIGGFADNGSSAAFEFVCIMHREGLMCTWLIWYELDHIVGSILIDMYARLGNNNNALGLFQGLPKKDALAWSGLIIECATTGRSWLAFSLFRDMVYLGIKVDQSVISFILKVCSSLTSLGSGKQMTGSGLKPNEITHLGVLSACRHAGLRILIEQTVSSKFMVAQKGLGM